MKFQSIKTYNLKNHQVNQILNLKKTYWKHKLSSQQKWFKKNAKSYDLHNIMLKNKEIIGYTFLGNRSFKICKSKNNLLSKKYLLFATLILKKKYRNFFYASKIMNFNKKIIKKKKKPSLLLCKSNKIKFYKFFGWKNIKKKTFSTPDHPSNLYGMIFNFRNLSKYQYKFFYYL